MSLKNSEELEQKAWSSQHRILFKFFTLNLQDGCVNDWIVFC
ncbi:hypothetical protein LEP1GSC158_2708 [Leptospira interrogans serovar Zanoni str. LT2156]|uniref:Uncharacterized protein n=1 Tax=Leptospira interrogans serovar Zanoni str. LT2156 TaxID=1001601 RepID=M6HJI8_LEPIR|nr:hypothetical protein LEP1GSC158_2708 [Leptospira interrogans serovar Zanoni str. LT2156]